MATSMTATMRKLKEYIRIVQWFKAQGVKPEKTLLMMRRVGTLPAGVVSNRGGRRVRKAKADKAGKAA